MVYEVCEVTHAVPFTSHIARSLRAEHRAGDPALWRMITCLEYGSPRATFPNFHWACGRAHRRHSTDAAPEARVSRPARRAPAPLAETRSADAREPSSNKSVICLMR